MKKLIFIAFVLLPSQKIFSNDTLYYHILRNCIELANRDNKLENYSQLASCCERILLAYKNEWLPYYYDAYAYINMSFIEKSEKNKEIYCNKAQDLIDEAVKIKTDESELFVLQSLLYYARMAISPMLNGPLYLPKATGALNDAEKLEPDNPRIYYLRGNSIINTPKFFGGGKEVALPVLEKALIMYKNFKQKSTIHPNWGKEDTESLYKKCKKD